MRRCVLFVVIVVSWLTISQFGDSTLLVIAHRLSTIADFDRILVMSEGKAVEFGSPAELLEKKGVFAEMVGSSGEKELLEKIIRAGP